MMLPNQWNNSVAQASLMPPASSPERYIELWWHSGATVGLSGATTAGQYWASKGGGTINTGTSSAIRLHTLNPSWSPNIKFAFEAFFMSAAGAGAAVYLALWDFTSGTIVSASQISQTTANITPVRSGQFSLIPGHVYGVTVWAANATPTNNFTDVSLIVFS